MIQSAILVFIFGAIVGSFLNVCIARIPKGASLVSPPSHCPNCKDPIRFYDNIPLVSYIFLLGRCRSCGEGISPRYFVVELLMASLAAALNYEFGLSLAFFVGFVFVAGLIVISFIDLDVRIVPDVISLPGIVAGLLFSVVARYVINDPFELIPSPLNALIGVLVGGGFLLALAWGYEAFTGVEGMGGGDIKLLAMIGAFLGWTSIPFTLFFASLTGSVIGLGFMIGKGVGRRFGLPFAPFLCLGALLYLFFGNELIQFYLPER
ncbi:MAG TPA: A24 family peptidase [Candidatus Bathyarchaeia archaeon]|jgi:leader peptidase (prepilin peptidase)/N-methyltransferase|nr:A24 family peptidase [Candidatus Bathyarchaeia archaeon]